MDESGRRLALAPFLRGLALLEQAHFLFTHLTAQLEKALPRVLRCGHDRFGQTAPPKFGALQRDADPDRRLPALRPHRHGLKVPGSLGVGAGLNQARRLLLLIRGDLSPVTSLSRLIFVNLRAGAHVCSRHRAKDCSISLVSLSKLLSGRVLFDVPLTICNADRESPIDGGSMLKEGGRRWRNQRVGRGPRRPTKWRRCAVRTSC